MKVIRSNTQFFFEVVLSAALYLAVFYFNQMITTPLEDTKGVNWIFLPAGVRIFLTLIFDYSGAIGLSIASLLINYIGFFELDFTSTFGIAIICGIAPLLARYFVIQGLQLRADLSDISFNRLLMIIVFYSLLSAGLHQLWFVTIGFSSGSWDHLIAMFFGDIVGSILFVAIIKYGIDLVKNKLGRDNLIE
jgi:hypothetical protein